jgi:uncharacterized OB-fold protein
MADIPKPLPKATPDTQEFWDGLKRHELRVQACNDCGKSYLYPRPFCPREGCHSRNVEWVTQTGKGTLATYIVAHRGHPAFNQDGPYVIAVVELDTGARLMTNILGVEDPTPEKLVVGSAVEIVYTDVNDDVTLPHFQLA